MHTAVVKAGIALAWLFKYYVPVSDKGTYILALSLKTKFIHNIIIFLLGKYYNLYGGWEKSLVERESL